ncbi:hypothetical protein H696_04329 [Fonticula alba]|uniref:Rab-GAP TBC domain-containing protein n=1 Tax=Fonticula alba TaxID=691883 RepID=A0A058Z3S9_FONAL|nr:hypothetical protein H696_04329 [Fonticula alba]KCV68910.1 hypothetical protein H696_04329 [Fonticula alba]|eukprot:XP_009496481.1 hypothetical protein H696_04329 [Fonticula alba]
MLQSICHSCHSLDGVVFLQEIVGHVEDVLPSALPLLSAFSVASSSQLDRRRLTLWQQSEARRYRSWLSGLAIGMFGTGGVSTGATAAGGDFPSPEVDSTGGSPLGGRPARGPASPGSGPPAASSPGGAASPGHPMSQHSRSASAEASLGGAGPGRPVSGQLCCEFTELASLYLEFRCCVSPATEAMSLLGSAAAGASPRLASAGASDGPSRLKPGDLLATGASDDAASFDLGLSSRSRVFIPRPPAVTPPWWWPSIPQQALAILPTSFVGSSLGPNGLAGTSGTDGCSPATGRLPLASPFIDRVGSFHAASHPTPAGAPACGHLPSFSPGLPPGSVLRPTAADRLDASLSAHLHSLTSSMAFPTFLPADAGLAHKPLVHSLLVQSIQQGMGLPSNHRIEVWLRCSGALELAADSLSRWMLHGIPSAERSLLLSGGGIVHTPYLNLVSLAKSSLSPRYGQLRREIYRDIGRTFPQEADFAHFCTSEHLCEPCRKLNSPSLSQTVSRGDLPTCRGTSCGNDMLVDILLAYGARNPDVGYAQGMNFIAGTIIKAGASRTQAFWILAGLIERVLPPAFFGKRLEGSRIECDIVERLFESPATIERLLRAGYHADKSTLYRAIRRQGISSSAVLMGWMAALWSLSDLPSEIVLLIWDRLFTEGSAILTHTSVCLLACAEAAVLQQQAQARLSSSASSSVGSSSESLFGLSSFSSFFGAATGRPSRGAYPNPLSSMPGPGDPPRVSIKSISLSDLLDEPAAGRSALPEAPVPGPDPETEDGAEPPIDDPAHFRWKKALSWLSPGHEASTGAMPDAMALGPVASGPVTPGPMSSDAAESHLPVSDPPKADAPVADAQPSDPGVLPPPAPGAPLPASSRPTSPFETGSITVLSDEDLFLSGSDSSFQMLGPGFDSPSELQLFFNQAIQLALACGQAPGGRVPASPGPSASASAAGGLGSLGNVVSLPRPGGGDSTGPGAYLPYSTVLLEALTGPLLVNLQANRIAKLRSEATIRIQVEDNIAEDRLLQWKESNNF